VLGGTPRNRDLFTGGELEAAVVEHFDCDASGGRSAVCRHELDELAARPFARGRAARRCCAQAHRVNGLARALVERDGRAGTSTALEQLRLDVIGVTARRRSLEMLVQLGALPAIRSESRRAQVQPVASRGQGLRRAGVRDACAVACTHPFVRSREEDERLGRQRASGVHGEHAARVRERTLLVALLERAPREEDPGGGGGTLVLEGGAPEQRVDEIPTVALGGRFRGQEEDPRRAARRVGKRRNEKRFGAPRAAFGERRRRVAVCRIGHCLDARVRLHRLRRAVGAAARHRDHEAGKRKRSRAAATGSAARRESWRCH
jgi:hypothetical protein